MHSRSQRQNLCVYSDARIAVIASSGCHALILWPSQPGACNRASQASRAGCIAKPETPQLQLTTPHTCKSVRSALNHIHSTPVYVRKRILCSVVSSCAAQDPPATRISACPCRVLQLRACQSPSHVTQFCQQRVCKKITSDSHNATPSIPRSPHRSPGTTHERHCNRSRPRPNREADHDRGRGT